MNAQTSAAARSALKSINQQYRALGKPWVVLDLVASNTNAGQTYEIRAGGDGRIYCECVGWKMRKTCTHLKTFMAKRASQVNDAVAVRG